MSREDEILKTALAEMEKAKELGETDPKRAHIAADAILCQSIIMVGFEKLVEVFKQVDKWYS